MHQGVPLAKYTIQLYIGITIHFQLEVIMQVLHYWNNESLFTLDEGIVHYVMATINAFLQQMKVLFIWFYNS